MPEWTITPSEPRRIGVLLFSRFSNLCLANCLEPLRAANTLSGRELYHWQILSPDGAPVVSSSGLPVLPHSRADGVERMEELWVLASYDHLAHDTAGTRRLLRRLSGRAQRIVSHDMAPWLMASAGLLDGHRATVHWDLLDSFAERFPAVDAIRARVVADGRWVTCAGAMAAFDQTLAMIGDAAGAALALDIEALFMRSSAAPAPHDRPAPRRGETPIVERALALMRENIATPLDRRELARRVGCPAKTLDRRFQASLGAAPGTVYRHIRLSAALQLVTTSRTSITEVALRCGYESPAALARAFRARFGQAPSALRRSHAMD